MSKKIKSISDPKLKLEVLTPQDVQKIHDATLWIIEHVGVRFPSKRALEIWEANGATVDHEKKIVRAKPQLIEDALKKCPPKYILAARDPQQNCALDGNHVYLGTDGCGVEVIEELDKEGLRPRIKVLVGGAPITKEWAEKIKADGTSEDAVGAVQLAKKLVGKE